MVLTNFRHFIITFFGDKALHVRVFRKSKTFRKLLFIILKLIKTKQFFDLMQVDKMGKNFLLVSFEFILLS